MVKNEENKLKISKFVKYVAIEKKEAKYLDELLFNDLIHLEQTKDDTTVTKQLIKKIKA